LQAQARGYSYLGQRTGQNCFDAYNPLITHFVSQGGHHIQTFVGHSSLVRSVDFHPAAGASLLCSCDDGGKILFWKLNQVKHKPRTSEAVGSISARILSLQSNALLLYPIYGMLVLCGDADR
jgi:WD40 repeat protein